MFSPGNTYSHQNPQSLYAVTGERKYLTERERTAFIRAANRQPEQIRLLCLVLVYSGCRLSEALELTPDSVLEDENALLIRSLKKRGKIVHRRIPLPKAFVGELCQFARQKPSGRQLNGKCYSAFPATVSGQTTAKDSISEPIRLFPWGRTQALHHVQRVMQQSSITGIRATARGLRHTFATHATLSGIPLHLIQRWLGHTRAETTAIYADILGEEERQLAERMW